MCDILDCNGGNFQTYSLETESALLPLLIKELGPCFSLSGTGLAVMGLCPNPSLCPVLWHYPVLSIPYSTDLVLITNASHLSQIRLISAIFAYNYFLLTQ